MREQSTEQIIVTGERGKLGATLKRDKDSYLLTELTIILNPNFATH
jgi:hypothetical protein